jgi:PAS domain S-box-containing protein
MLNMIVDKSGRVIALSNELRSLIPSLKAHTGFLDHFISDQAFALDKLFNEAKKSENVSSINIEIPSAGEKKEKYSISISPMNSENNVYFLVSFIPDHSETVSSDIRKFYLSATKLEKFTSSEKIARVIEKIKQSYPFSFIEKAKIQKEINELEDFFWLKDIEGKFVLVNDRYSIALGFKSNQLENKNESEILPKYIANIYQTLDSYVKVSSNAIAVEGISDAVIGGINREVMIIELPLCDLDNNVVAIIGFSTRAVNAPISETNELDLSFVQSIPISFCLLDSDNKFIAYSTELLKLFAIGEKINLVGQSLNKIFEKDFVRLIETYQNDRSITGEASFTYAFNERTKIISEIKLTRLVSENGEVYQLVIVPKEEEDTQSILKAKMYDALIEHTPEALFIYDLDNLKFLEVNDQALKLYGYKRSDFLNMDLTDLYAPEDIQTLVETADNKSLSGSYSGPWRHKRSDGNSVLVELRRSSIEYGGKKAHLNLVRNVSEQAEVKKKQQLLESLYENTSDVLITTDKDGFIKDANDTAIKKLGYPKRDLDGRPLISLLSDDDRANVNKNIFHSGLLKISTIDVEMKKPSGSFQKATIVATPIKNFHGEIDSFSFIIKLAEEHSLAKDLNHTQDESTEKIDESFLSNMFHEILTPINVILGFTQEIGESIPNPNDEQKEAIEIIKENQKMLLQIMDNAVEYSTLEQKVIKFRPEEIKFVDLINELKELTRKTAESKKIELSYGKISSTLSLETDKQRFIYLLSLFLKFAIQITKEKSIILSASVYNENYCAVGIKDSSSGISQFLLKSLNEVFSDDENVTRRNYGFSRFSVKLAKKIIELLSVKKEVIMKGEITSEYALIFPLKFVVGDKEKSEIAAPEHEKHLHLSNKQKIEILPRAQIVESAVHKVAVEASRPFDISQLSCLYLEDQLDSQMLFKVQLKDLKSIEFAVSFEAALPLLKTKKFDFIIMDINLQGEYNGLDALRIIQRMPGYKNIPIIASTAYVQVGARERFIEAGFTDFISKPLLRDKLIEVIKNILA